VAAVKGECWIHLTKCNNHPHVSTNPFRDNWGEAHKNAGTNPAKCMERARDHYNWCGMSGKAASAKAEFRTGGKVTTVETYDYAAANHGCFITLPSCPNHPKAGCAGKFPCTFKDTWGHQHRNALEDPKACHKRATDHYNWCGMDITSKTVVGSTHFKKGVKTSSSVYTSKCIMTLASCPKQKSFNAGGKWPYTFIDAWGEQNRNAGTSEKACFQRAIDHKNWCGLKSQADSKAMFRTSSGLRTDTWKACTHMACHMQNGKHCALKTNPGELKHRCGVNGPHYDPVHHRAFPYFESSGKRLPARIVVTHKGTEQHGTEHKCISKNGKCNCLCRKGY
jgi:hypothetical protein